MAVYSYSKSYSQYIAFRQNTLNMASIQGILIALEYVLSLFTSIRDRNHCAMQSKKIQNDKQNDKLELIK